MRMKALLPFQKKFLGSKPGIFGAPITGPELFDALFLLILWLLFLFVPLLEPSSSSRSLPLLPPSLSFLHTNFSSHSFVCLLFLWSSKSSFLLYHLLHWSQLYFVCLLLV